MWLGPRWAIDRIGSVDRLPFGGVWRQAAAAAAAARDELWGPWIDRSIAPRASRFWGPAVGRWSIVDGANGDRHPLVCGGVGLVPLPLLCAPFVGGGGRDWAAALLLRGRRRLEPGRLIDGCHRSIDRPTYLPTHFHPHPHTPTPGEESPGSAQRPPSFLPSFLPSPLLFPLLFSFEQELWRRPRCCPPRRRRRRLGRTSAASPLMRSRCVIVIVGCD